MAYWTYPSDVTSYDDKLNYWREQYNSLGEENGTLLGNAADLQAVLNYRGWTNENIDSIAKLQQLHGIQGILNNYNVKWGSDDKQVFWTKSFNTANQGFINISIENCPQDLSYYNNYTGYIMRPFYCRVPYIEGAYNINLSDDVKAKNPYILVGNYGLYNDSSKSSMIISIAK